jgi:enoyl ACP reductase
MSGGGAVVGLTLDATVAWPGYDWMGVAKAAFEATNRYCACTYGAAGIRCNLVAAGPISTTAAKSIPAFGRFAEWGQHAPLGWNQADPDPGGEGLRGVAVGLVPGDDGGDRPRRRRLPLLGGLTVRAGNRADSLSGVGVSPM